MSMIASLLSPTPQQQQPRISQLLPSVKCSTCHQPVPLSELGEHTCTAPPAVPSLPKPAFTPEAATALLPGRLQGRLQQGRNGGSPNGPPAGATPPPQQQQRGQDHQRMPSSASTRSGRLNVNTRTGGVSPTQQQQQQQRSSPLTDSPRMGELEAPFGAAGSSPSSFRNRMRTPSNAGSISIVNSPATTAPPRLASFNSQEGRSGAPPPSSFGGPQRTGSPALSVNGYPNRGGPPSSYNTPNTNNNVHLNNNAVPPPNPGPGSTIVFPSTGAPPQSGAQATTAPESFVPPSERGIDTKTGGEAGMAGVGRRGFAAAARAAMFVSPQVNSSYGTSGADGAYGRRPSNAPHFLDIDAVSRSASNSTPPLSTGSGYSSPSPGPTSPIPQLDPRYPLPNSSFNSNSNNNFNNNTLGAKPPQNQSRTPSPFDSPNTATPIQKNMAPSINTNLGISNMNTQTPTSATASPISGRLPFFDKLRNGGRIPGLEGPPPSESLPPIPSGGTPTRSNSTATSVNSISILSGSLSRKQSGPEREPMSPTDSDSDYGGLAYADSTDDEAADDFNSRRSSSVRRKQLPPVPGSGAGAGQTPLAAAPAILERASRHMQFGSVSERSRSRSRSRSNDRGDIRIGGKGPMTMSVVSGRSGDESVYSFSSEVDGEGGGDRQGRSSTRGAAAVSIAQALGLSTKGVGAEAEYGRLGGPGMVMRSESRSRSQSRTRETEGGGASAGQQQALDRSMSSSTSSSAVGRRLYGGSSISGSVTSSSSGRLRKLDMKAANGYGNVKSIVNNNANANEDESEPVTAMQRSRTVQGTQSPEAAKKAIKLPMRSLTSPSPKITSDKALVEGGGSGGAGAGSVGVGAAGKKTKARVRSCMRCAKTIDDGRWVSVDGGGVLCEKCWKNMYLPKCRRCNLVIERAAVSSSDGQLKGKYHKECFNCHTCHKPFPDKSFYVYDGKPLCAYHYHEANDSLCSAALCGQPIEGPCAVSHTGDRYHPEHMTCEYPGYPECRERLKDYWEVDGRMLCERHAHYATTGGGGSGEEEDEEWVQSSRAKKRVTRFIDLAGAAGLGGGAKEDSGLR